MAILLPARELPKGDGLNFIRGQSNKRAIGCQGGACRSILDPTSFFCYSPHGERCRSRRVVRGFSYRVEALHIIGNRIFIAITPLTRERGESHASRRDMIGFTNARVAFPLRPDQDSRNRSISLLPLPSLRRFELVVPLFALLTPKPPGPE